jgi:hypothetical protein
MTTEWASASRSAWGTGPANRRCRRGTTASGWAPRRRRRCRGLANPRAARSCRYRRRRRTRRTARGFRERGRVVACRDPKSARGSLRKTGSRPIGKPGEPTG